MLFIIILYIKPVFKITDEIVFIDLPSGEATLISSKFNQSNILIDTGGKVSFNNETYNSNCK